MQPHLVCRAGGSGGFIKKTFARNTALRQKRKADRIGTKVLKFQMHPSIATVLTNGIPYPRVWLLLPFEPKLYINSISTLFPRVNVFCKLSHFSLLLYAPMP